jgi:2-oxoglutarate dehydrogenase E2 component (dihydrolipoamide succinyltransferase)
VTNIVVPELGESVVEARIARWLKKEGDRVEVGEAVVELETEKIDLEVNAEKGGVLASIKRHEGEDVKIGELLAVVDETAAGKPVAGGNGAAAGAAAPQAPAPAPSAASAPAQAGSAADAPKATPTAKRMAKDHDVNLGGVQGSGAAADEWLAISNACSTSTF